jgi:DnaJ family protein C protein 27
MSDTNGKNLNLKKQLRVKIISMGDAEVGKSCMIKRYCEKRFVPKYMQTIGIDYGVTKVNIKDRDVKVNIFDMSGHPVFFEVRNEFYKDTQGAILVFDVNNRSSFESLEKWLNELMNEFYGSQQSTTTNILDNVVVILCGNKIDKGKRAVDEAEAKLWASLKGLYYFEVSASSGSGVNEMFDKLFNEVVNACDNGGKPIKAQINLGFNKEQVEAIQRLKNAKDNYERLGLKPGCNKDEINNAYRRLAVKFHPDKNVAPGAEDAFKIIVNARTDLLKQFSN